jgi:hypothetical protein
VLLLFSDFSSILCNPIWVVNTDAPAGPAAEQILQQATRASRRAGRSGARWKTEPERMGGGLAGNYRWGPA